MPTAMPIAADRSALRIESLVKANGELELSLATFTVPRPGPDEVLLQVEAAPINPSDLALLLAGADATRLEPSGTAERPTVTGKVPSTASLTLRLGHAVPAGNEGAGTVVERARPPPRRRCSVRRCRLRRAAVCMPSTAWYARSSACR